MNDRPNQAGDTRSENCMVEVHTGRQKHIHTPVFPLQRFDILKYPFKPLFHPWHPVPKARWAGCISFFLSFLLLPLNPLSPFYLLLLHSPTSSSCSSSSSKRGEHFLGVCVVSSGREMPLPEIVLSRTGSPQPNYTLP